MAPIPTVYLADTSVFSELLKKSPQPQILLWLQGVERLGISAVTLEQAHYSLASQPNARKLALFNALVARLHAVYPITDSLAQRSGSLRGQLQAQGMARSAADMLLAATAQEHQLVLASRDVQRFVGCGVQVFNPFEFAPGGPLEA